MFRESSDAGPPRIHVISPDGPATVDLSGEHDAVTWGPAGPQPAAEELLAAPVRLTALWDRVHLGGVEEVDAGVECGVEEAERLRQPALLPHRHRPEAEAGDGEVGGEVEGGHRHRRRPPRRTVANPSPPPWRI